MPTSIPPALAVELANVIVGCGEQATAALIDLIYAVSDPNGDKHKYETAWVVIRAAMPFVPDYDELCKKHCERMVETDVSESETSVS